MIYVVVTVFAQVWLSDNGPEFGTVRWVGILPDSRDKEWTVGVEFDRAIGTVKHIECELLFTLWSVEACFSPLLIYLG